MIGIQLLAILFVLWMTYFTYLHYRRKEFTISEFAFWQVIWTSLFLVVLFPTRLQSILNLFNISRVFDLLVVGGIVILFGVTFRNYVLLRRTERQLEKLVRSLALSPKKDE